jgi:hypothetical protein
VDGAGDWRDISPMWASTIKNSMASVYIITAGLCCVWCQSYPPLHHSFHGYQWPDSVSCQLPGHALLNCQFDSRLSIAPSSSGTRCRCTHLAHTGMDSSPVKSILIGICGFML